MGPMSQTGDARSPRTALARIRKLRKLLGPGSDFGFGIPALQDLLRDTRQRLLEYARCIGLTGIHRLSKALLAERVQREVARLVVLASAPSAPRGRRPTLGAGRAPDGASAADGVTAEHVPAQGPEEHIPWAHGHDRITTMVVDPERLYAYWEVTDEAIERARAALGPGGQDAWLNLRVYDVTNRIFDGTNAHGYFDHSVSRADRQWFFFIGKPASTAVVEIGLKSEEGDFIRVARSGRTDFPRRESAPAGRAEWLTVRSAVGEVGAPSIETRERPMPAPSARARAAEPAPERTWSIPSAHAGDAEPRVSREAFESTWWERGHWARARVTEWAGSTIRSTWEAGPFSYPVEVGRYVEERWDGTAMVRSVEGRTHVVYGSWQVVIRGLGARAERKVLAVWEIHRSWIAHSEGSALPEGGATTASAPLGASEWRRQAASELRLGGASELYWLGASELRYLGASELQYMGASEWRERGASELRLRGASELRLAGASEVRFGGASEVRFGGASEARFGGASETRLGGASEARLGGASDMRARYPAERAEAPGE